jgi:hypothetical protein
MLDALELPQVQEITTYERRMLAEHKPPSMAGSLLQNLGRNPMRLALWGVATGAEALRFVEELNTKFLAGEPVTFVTDIVADAEIEFMVIDDLKIQDLAGRPQRYTYALVLQEYIEPIVEPEDVSSLEDGILEDAQSLMDDLVEGLDLGFDFATGLERFVDPLSTLLTRLQEANRAVDQSNQP